MIPYVIQALRTNQHYATATLEGIAADQACVQPHGTMNPPAWIIGHIVTSHDMLITMLGGEPVLKDRPQWNDLFDRGGASDGTVAYPPWEQLLAAFGDVHDRLAELLPTVDAATLEQPLPDEEMRTVFPTVGDCIVGVVTMHEGVHLGQLSAWRAAVGMDLAI